MIVDRIRKSGAVILGHTNVPRFALDYQVWLSSLNQMTIDLLGAAGDQEEFRSCWGER